MSENTSYIQERLESLHEIDTRIVSFLGNMSKAISALQVAKQTGEKSQIESFKESTGKCYEDLSFTATHFRREIKLLADAMKNNGRNDGFIMLPAQIDKKASWVNGSKTREELSELDKLIKEEKVAVKGEDEENVEVNKKEDSLQEKAAKSEVTGEENELNSIKVETDDKNKGQNETREQLIQSSKKEDEVKKEDEDIEMTDI